MFVVWCCIEEWKKWQKPKLQEKRLRQAEDRSQRCVHDDLRQAAYQLMQVQLQLHYKCYITNVICNIYKFFILLYDVLMY